MALAYPPWLRSGVVRIAYFADTPRLGGAEALLVFMVEAAVGAGHDVSLIAPQEWLLDHVAEQVPGVRLRRAGRPERLERASLAGRLAGMGGELRTLGAAIRAERPDLLHSSNGGYPGSLLCCGAVVAAKTIGVAHRVLSSHAAPRPRGELTPPLDRLIDASVWRSVSAVVGSTNFVGRRLHELRGMPRELYHVVPNVGSEPQGLERGAAVRDELAADGELLVGMVSAASDEQKGHAVLVEALGQAPADVRAVVVGAPLPDGARERAEALGLGQRLNVLGRVAELGPLIGALDVLVVPSVRDEGVPLVIPEAMAAGKPVVASRLSGIPEVVEDGVTGRLFEPGDAAGLAAVLGELAADRRELQGWGSAGRELWAERYSPRAMAEGTLALYRSLAEGR